jgi:hypothetical protein
MAGMMTLLKLSVTMQFLKGFTLRFTTIGGSDTIFCNDFSF